MCENDAPGDGRLDLGDNGDGLRRQRRRRLAAVVLRCGLCVKSAADAQQKLFDAVDPPPPTAVQIAVEDFAAKFAAMNSIAPTGIKSDVATLNGVAQQLANVVRTSKYDVVAMIGTKEFAALTTTFSSATYTSAQDRFQRYIDTNCGFATTTPGT